MSIEEMKNIDIRTVDPETLVDVNITQYHHLYAPVHPEPAALRSESAGCPRLAYNVSVPGGSISFSFRDWLVDLRKALFSPILYRLIQTKTAFRK